MVSLASVSIISTVNTSLGTFRGSLIACRSMLVKAKGGEMLEKMKCPDLLSCDMCWNELHEAGGWTWRQELLLEKRAEGFLCGSWRKQKCNQTQWTAGQSVVTTPWRAFHTSSGTKTITAMGQARALGLGPAERLASSTEPDCFILQVRFGCYLPVDDAPKELNIIAFHIPFNLLSCCMDVEAATQNRTTYLLITRSSFVD